MPNDWGDYEGSGGALADSLLPSFLTPQRRPQVPLQPAVPPLPGALPGLPPMPQGAPPPGFLAGALGGLETPAGVVGAPVPLGPATTTPGGMGVTPVSNPQSAPAPSNGPLDALRQQMGVINQLVGAAPQQPFVRDQINEGPTQTTGRHGGFGGLSSGPSQVTANQGDLANLATFNQLSAGRGQDVGQLLGRLGTMGNQAIQGGQLSLDAIRTLNPGGTLDANSRERLHDTQLATSYMNGEAAHIAAGGSAESWATQWRELGRPMPSFLQGRNPQATGAAPGGAPSGTPPLPGAPASAANGALGPPVPQQSPASRMEETLRNVTRRQLGNAPGQPQRQFDATNASAGITDFVNTLGGPFVQQNTPAVMRMISDRFGAPAADAWFTSRSGSVGRNTPQEDAIHMLAGAANRIAPGTVGFSQANEQTAGPSRFFRPVANPASLLNPGTFPR